MNMFVACSVYIHSVRKRMTNPPTISPTAIPSKPPTNAPTDVPTNLPTNVPTDIPSVAPSDAPTNIPIKRKTRDPTVNPSTTPTINMARFCCNGYGDRGLICKQREYDDCGVDGECYWNEHNCHTEEQETMNPTKQPIVIVQISEDSGSGSASGDQSGSHSAVLSSSDSDESQSNGDYNGRFYWNWRTMTRIKRRDLPIWRQESSDESDDSS